jgi:hypothetical protein
MSPIITHMSKNVPTISPEGLELANAYLSTGSLKEASNALQISESEASAILDRAEVKRYIDNVYLDLGYRNRFKLAETLDEIIEHKLAEAQEADHYTSKDLLELLQFAHKIRQDELKAQQNSTQIKQQTNVQINETPFGQGNYAALMEKLLNGQ